MDVLVIIWTRATWWGIALLILGTVEVAAADQRRVLLLHSFSYAVSTWDDTAASFREDLIKLSPEPIDLHDIAFDAVRYRDPQEEGPFVEYLHSLFLGRKVDLIVPVGAPAAHFLQRHRPQLFPSAPMLISAAEERRIPAATLGANDTIVNSTVDLSAYIENILHLLPDTKNIAVVIGSSPVERYWLAETRLASQTFAGRVNFIWLNDLSFDEMLKQAAALTPQSAILYFVFAEDAKGVSYPKDNALDALRDVAKAPIFGVGDSQLNRGIVGGPLLQSRALGHRTAEVALRILKGEKASDIKSTPVGFGTLTYDWRELQRWGISEARLPPDSIVLFKEPSLWDQHRNLVLATAVLFALQSLIVAALLFQRRRRRQAEVSLKESEDRMSFTAASVNVGLWQYDRSTDELWATEHSRAMFGLASDFPITRETFLAAVHSEDRGIAIGAIRGVLRGRQSPTTDVRIVLTDGQVRWIRVRVRSRLSDRGTPGQLSGLFVDITEQRAAESEAESRRQEVTHLTRVTVLGELSGAIAHEVNQPLSAILSNAQAALHLLPKSPNFDEIRGALEDIVQEDNRAAEVIKRLRVLLKKGVTKSELVDLNQLVNWTTTLLRKELIDRRIVVETNLANDLPAVFGDPVQLQQVLLNLIMNAMDAMASTSVAQRQVEICTRATPNGTVVSVRDHGPGINPSDGNQPFKAFYTTKEHGLGLGLSICSTILQGHEGKISLRNDDAGGAIAEFSLPTHGMLMAAQ